MLNFGPLGSGVGYGFSLWFEGFGEIVSPHFRTRPTIISIACCFRKMGNYKKYELGQTIGKSRGTHIPILRK